jgi:hypothetical protein
MNMGTILMMASKMVSRVMKMVMLVSLNAPKYRRFIRLADQPRG